MAISKTILQEINRRFASEDANQVVMALSNASDDIAGSERIQFAILKLAKGNLKEFNEALHLASLDWRDALGAAGMSEMNWPDVVLAEGMADESWHHWELMRREEGSSRKDTKKKDTEKKAPFQNRLLRFIIRWVIILAASALFLYGALWAAAHPNSPIALVFVVGIIVLFLLSHFLGWFKFLRDLFK